MDIDSSNIIEIPLAALIALAYNIVTITLVAN